jgi:ABC-type Na+ efflux pump permease subunit
LHLIYESNSTENIGFYKKNRANKKKETKIKEKNKKKININTQENKNKIKAQQQQKQKKTQEIQVFFVCFILFFFLVIIPVVFFGVSVFDCGCVFFLKST